MSRAIVFAYHNVGVRCLSVLLAHGVDVVRVVTHQDSPTETIWFDSVAELAKRHGIPVITPEDPNDPAVVAELAALQPDFLFSFYYRLMLKAPLLALPKHGAWNMHGSLLPKYRGRVPVNWAVIHGERETGATLHRMVEKPDAGGIVAQQGVPILPDDTAFDVFNKVTLAAEIALDNVLPDLLAGRAKAKPQDLAAGSYFGGRKAEDGRIDWNQPAAAVHNLIRAVAPPYPGAFSDTAKGRLKVLRSLHPSGETGPYGGRPTLFLRNGHLYAECGDGQLLRLLAVELAGSPLAASSADNQINAIFGTPALSLP
jgi:methionyl-tRNA formyltransferase